MKRADWAQAHIDEIEAACLGDGPDGFCISCSAEAYGVEPDARRYACEACGEHSVYGAQELLFDVAF